MTAFQIPDALPLLSRGNHAPGSGKACIMDAISIISGKPQEQDHPSCVHPMLRPLFIAVNDSVPDRERHKLWPLGLRAMGTADAVQLSSGDATLDDREGVVDRHAAVRVLMNTARAQYAQLDGFRPAEHPAGRIVPTILSWLQRPNHADRKRIYQFWSATKPKSDPMSCVCEGCQTLYGASRAIFTAAIDNASPLSRVADQLRNAATPAQKFAILGAVLDEFDRSTVRVPREQPVPDWDTLRADLGIVTVAS